MYVYSVGRRCLLSARKFRAGGLAFRLLPLLTFTASPESNHNVPPPVGLAVVGRRVVGLVVAVGGFWATNGGPRMQFAIRLFSVSRGSRRRRSGLT